MRTDIKNFIEAELRDYHKTKKDLEEAKEDIASEGIIPTMSHAQSGPTYKINRATESKAMKLVTNKRIKRMEDVINAIDIVLGELPEDRIELIELKYWQRPRKLTDAGIWTRLSIDRSTFYRWDYGIKIAIAVELGLMQDPKLRQRCDF